MVSAHLRATRLALVLAGLCAAACDGGGGSSSPSLSLTFARVAGPGLDPVQVTVTGAGRMPELTVDRGSLTTPVAAGNGTFVALLTPTSTGEHRVSVTLGSSVVARTVLVLQDVHADWGQPLAVEGLVNTDGYEDGITIAPDGRTLFVQYGAFRWASLLVFQESRANGGCGGDRLTPVRCSHPWLDTTLGPMAGPERPGFFTDRFAGTTQLHSAASWGLGVDGSPVLALTTLFYGFRRQPDGSFAEPFFLAFDDLGDGITGPFGLAFLPLGGENHLALFTLQDSATVATGFDVHACEVVFGQDNFLGTYAATTPGNPPVRSLPFPSTLVDLGDNSGTQGNPSLHVQDDVVLSVWTDDEYDQDGDTGKITAHVLASGVFPDSASYTTVVLPEVVNQPGTSAIQPTFRSEGLYFTQDTSIAFAAYSGLHEAAFLADDLNWSAPVTLLQKDTSIVGAITANDLGKIVAIGEPTLATLDGRLVLYFVYAWVRGIDPLTNLPDLDFQAGWVERNP